MLDKCAALRSMYRNTAVRPVLHAACPVQQCASLLRSMYCTAVRPAIYAACAARQCALDLALALCRKDLASAASRCCWALGAIT